MKYLLLPTLFAAVWTHTAAAQTELKTSGMNMVADIRFGQVPSDWRTNTKMPTIQEQPAASTPVRFVSAKKDGTVYQRLEFKNGGSEEVWRFDSYVGWKDRQGNLLLFRASKSPEEIPDPFFFQAKYPPGLDWLKPQFFIAPTKDAKQEAFRYYSTETPLPGQLEMIPARAWVDSQSGLPLAAQRGTLVFTYKFGETPAIPALPAELELQYKAARKVNAFIKTMRERHPR